MNHSDAPHVIIEDAAISSEIEDACYFSSFKAAVRFPVAANHGVVADGDASQDADIGKDGDVVS